MLRGEAILIPMRKTTIAVDDQVAAEASRALGTKGLTATVNESMREVVAMAARRPARHRCPAGNASPTAPPADVRSRYLSRMPPPEIRVRRTLPSSLLKACPPAFRCLRGSLLVRFC